MKLTIKSTIAGLFLLILASCAHAQDDPIIDESNVISQLLSLGDATPAQANSYFTGKKYTLVSRSVKNMGSYEGTFIKYKIVDSTDSYSIVCIKEKIINAMCITYSKDLYLKALEQARKMGFAATEVTTSNPNQAVYSRGNERFIVQTNIVNGKTFYVMGANNVLNTGKAILAGK